jgi:hypothetical protein
MTKKQLIKLLVLFAFVAGFVFTGLFFYKVIVKKNSFKMDQFKDGKSY